MRQEALIPKVGVVTDIRQDTPDVKTFRVVGLDGNKLFEHMPGQCAMVSIPGIGEGMFSITSSPTNKEFMEFSIKKCGCLTSWLHMMEVGQEVTVRGPLGKNFPVETVPTPENGNYGLPTMQTVFPCARRRSMAAAFSSGRTSESTWSIPTSAAMASAVRA